jgi:hypothetical protein
VAPVREVKRAKFKEANLVLETHMREAGFHFSPEFKFYEERDWRADYVIHHENGPILVEIEGGVGYFKNPKGQVIRGGRHSREEGYRSDLEKYRMASALGYKLFRFSTREVLDGTAKAFLERWA